MKSDYRLPGPGDGADSLITLAAHLGDEKVFNIIRRCRTNRGADDVAARTLTLLAHRMVDQELKNSQATPSAARSTVARRLGYATTAIPNFNRILNGPRVDGDRELLNLARVHGDAEVFNLIRLCRAANSSGNDAGREALHTLANRIVRDETERSNVDLSTAKRIVADRLGYTAPNAGHGRSYFYQILKGNRPPDRRPNSRSRTTDPRKD